MLSKVKQWYAVQVAGILPLVACHKLSIRRGCFLA